VRRASSRRIIATSMRALLVCTVRSNSLLIRRFRDSQENVRPTIHLCGYWLHPRTAGVRLSTLGSQFPMILYQSATSCPWYAWSAQIVVSRGTTYFRPERSAACANVSCPLAGVTEKVRGKPKVSTKSWALLDL
jgi:hypothetical protein